MDAVTSEMIPPEVSIKLTKEETVSIQPAQRVDKSGQPYLCVKVTVNGEFRISSRLSPQVPLEDICLGVLRFVGDEPYGAPRYWGTLDLVAEIRALA